MSTDRPLRILHLTVASDPGGLSRYILDLSIAMRQQGHDVQIAGDVGPLQDEFDQSGVPYHRVPLRGGWFAQRTSAARLRSALKLDQFDVFHAHYRRATLLGRRLQMRLPPPRIGKLVRETVLPHPPLLYTLHLSHINVGFPRNLFTDFGDVTHVASADAQQWLIESGVKPHRIALIPHGIDVARFPPRDEPTRHRARQQLGLQADARVALFVGRLDHPKNEAWLLDLAARTEVPNLRVLLVGDGPNRETLQAALSRSRLQNVVLCGEQNPLIYYQAADALLLPSQREGFSYVCAEAMSVGVPIVRTRTSGTAETVVEHVTGISTPIDREAFIAAAEAFLRQPDERLTEMGQAAAAHVRKHLTFERQTGRTIELYRRLIPTPN
jgi:glycosyltransferase involved in cell wall biosynthesis